MTGSHGSEFPSGCSINDGIPQNTYLGEYFKLQLPQIDRLVEFTLKKGRNCLMFPKKTCAELIVSFPLIRRITIDSFVIIRANFILSLVLSVYIRQQ